MIAEILRNAEVDHSYKRTSDFDGVAATLQRHRPKSSICVNQRAPSKVSEVTTIYLPPLLLTANVAGVFEVCAQLEDAADPVVCDAANLMVAEPMALCALVATLSRMQRVRRDVSVLGLSPQFKRQLEDLDILGKSLYVPEHEKQSGYQGTLHAYRVKSEEEGNQIGNKIARSIASLVPSSRPSISASEPAPLDQSLVFPLAYIFTELIDNGLRHGRGRGYQT
jgi:hypothetical protein